MCDTYTCYAIFILSLILLGVFYRNNIKKVCWGSMYRLYNSINMKDNKMLWKKIFFKLNTTYNNLHHGVLPWKMFKYKI